MKLYYSPGACSLASHIVLQEAGLPFAVEKVDLRAKTTASGADFTAISRKGAVPALALDGGEVLTEGVAIMQYVADVAGTPGMSPAPGTLERARLQEMLNFIASEVHKAFGPMFTPGVSDDGKAAAVANVTRRLGQLDAMLADGRTWLLGETFTQADAYAFTIASWTNFVGIDISSLGHLGGFMARVAARPAVQATLRAEGLLA
jgi:glutathione S-transferase